MLTCLSKGVWTSRQQTHVNTPWPSDAIWQHRAGSTFIQGRPCHPMAPSLYLIHNNIILGRNGIYFTWVAASYRGEARGLWNNVDLSSLGSCIIYIGIILRKMLRIPIRKLSMIIVLFFKLLPPLHAANELTVPHTPYITSATPYISHFQWRISLGTSMTIWLTKIELMSLVKFAAYVYRAGLQMSRYTLSSCLPQFTD